MALVEFCRMKYRFCVAVFVLFAAPLNLAHSRTESREKERFYAKSTFSLLSVNNFGSIDYLKKVGNVDGNAKSSRMGLGFKQAFYLPVLPERTCLSVGIKYFEAKTRFHTYPTVPGITTSSYSDVELNHSFIAAPVYIEKTFLFGNQSSLNIFCGASFGLFGATGATSRWSLEKSEFDEDNIAVTFEPWPDLKPMKFYSALEIGGEYAPFRDVPNLSVGVFATYDLTKTPSFENGGYYLNETQYLSQRYDYSATVKYFHLAFSLNYSIGKKWKANLIK